MTRFTKYSALLCLVLLASSCLASYCAEEPSLAPVSIDMKDISFAKAIETLFKIAKFNFSVDPQLRWRLIPHISFKDVPFDVAVQNLAKTAGVVYRNEGDIWLFSSQPGYNAPLEKIVSLDVRQGETLGKVLEGLLAGSGVSYTAVPDIANLPVPPTAADKVMVMDAVDKVAKAAGVTYERTDAALTFAPAANRPVNLEVKDVELAQVMDSLFRGTGRSYTLDPAIMGIKVTAVLKNVDFQVALGQVTKAAGAVYRVDGNVYAISPKPAPELYVPPGQLDRSGWTTATIPLAWVEPGDVIRALKSLDEAEVVASSTKSITLRGAPASIEDAKRLITMIDTPDALPRAIRVKLTAKATLQRAGAKPQVWGSSTQSVGLEGVEMPLNVSGARQTMYYVDTGSAKGAKTRVPQFIDTRVRLASTLTPTIIPGAKAAESVVSLNGHGLVEGDLGPGKVPGDTTHFDKEYEVAVSTAPGESVLVASGSFDIGSDSISFEVTATVWIEPARVARLQVQQSPKDGPGYGGGGGGGYGTRGGPTGGGGGGGYGGYSGGGYKGSANRSW